MFLNDDFLYYLCLYKQRGGFMIYLPIIGSFCQATVLTFRKSITRNHYITSKNYNIYFFFLIFLIMLPVSLYFWDIEPDAFKFSNIILLGFLFLLATVANIFLTKGIKKEKLNQIEPIIQSGPLIVITITFILSFLFEIYRPERNLLLLIPALIASFTLVVSRIEKHHFKYDKYILYAFFAVLLFSLEMVLTRPILEYMSGFTFYFLRSVFIVIITLVLYHPHLKKPENKIIGLIFLQSLFLIGFRLILYYGYENLGIIFTTTIFILSPVFVFSESRIFLKEKLNKKQIITSIIIILCVVAAIVIHVS